MPAPLRIAFASCISSRLFQEQPVWDWIAARQPDHLVLLGDSLYLDVPLAGTHPSDMGDDAFAQHLYANYTHLMAQPRFKALVQGLPAGRVWSIWDDHDFLWNDAAGASLAQSPVHREKIRLSTAFQEAFRRALAQRLQAGAFPDAYNRAEFWDPAQPVLSTPSVQLASSVWLHLSDGRTHRTGTWLVPESKRALLGSAQRATLQAAVEAAPQALHLLASGSTLGAYKRGFEAEWKWLLALASQQQMMVLSGDIHRNESDAFHTGGWPLHEATSSGAAVRDAVQFGRRRRNYGLLDIAADTVTVRLYANDQEETRWTRQLSRATWQPV